MDENTVKKTAENRDGNGHFKLGTRPGPGRPKGLRNKSSQEAEQIRSWVLDRGFRIILKKNGKRWLEQKWAKDPEGFIRLMQSFFPKEQGVKAEATVDVITAHTNRRFFYEILQRAGVINREIS